MQRLRKHLRFIAAFLMVNTLYYTLYPTVAWALTAGPTAPEATSFEPVDTTEMVDLLTGDLVYNTPLMEVPGPSGGYPLSLSYHGGIMTNEEASWVGLGWTLNPGSLTRSVNGYADDHLNAKVSDRFFWEGGETTVTKIGLSYAGITAGISVGHDTYQGSGTGFFFGYGFSTFGEYGSNVGLGFNLGGGVDPWGNLETSVGAGVALRSSESASLQLGGGAGISTNMESVSGYANGSVNYKTGSSTNSKGRLVGNYNSGVGASISSSSNGISSSFSVGGGGFGINNSKTGNISTRSSGFSLPIPYVHLSYNYTRYWIDETEMQETNGSLYYPDQAVSVSSLNDHAYDTYSLQTLESIIDNIEPDRVKGGTLPNYDDYSVNAQGITGSIKPHFYQKYLHKENFRNYNQQTESYDNDIVHFSLGYDQKPVEFRFVNDFSNQFQYQTSLNDFTSDDSSLATSLEYDFVADADLKTGESGSDGIIDNDLAGSKHIQYITNDQILSNSIKKYEIGFIDTKTTGFDRASTPSDQIGGFVVTNESGVKYHFSLPVYAYDEYRYSENVYKASGSTFNETKKPEKYAYTWFLTAISGPDYVDRGSPGMDDTDWGYWVEFEYGKWTDQYAWRNPEEGFKMNKDYNFKDYSSGKKELYYLDAIRTESHTALFFKDIRHDSKSALSYINSIDQTTRLSPDFQPKDNPSLEGKEGGFTPKRIQCSCELEETFLDKKDHFTLDYYSRPVSTLKLDRIVLLNNDALSEINLDKLAGQPYEQTYNYDWIKHDHELLGTPFFGCDDYIASAHFKSHLPENVFDKYDINQSVIDKAQRVVEFNYDYSLAPETINSFDYKKANTSDPSSDPNDYELFGKLTLNSLAFLGKGGAGLIPPTKFGYDLADPELGANWFTGTSDGSGLTMYEPAANLMKGDILRLSNAENQHYGLVENIQNGLVTVKNIGKEVPLAGYYNWQQTKNPPYNKDAYDHWNSYKSDYVDGEDENIDRITTKISALSVDAWSLRTITTGVGSVIGLEYESDSYSEAVLYRNNSLIIKKFKDEDISNGRVRIEFSNNQKNLQEIFSPNDLIDLIVLYREDNVLPQGSQDNDPTAQTLPAGVNGYMYRNTLPIYSVFNNTITIESNNFVNFFFDYDEGDPNDDSQPPFSRSIVGGNMSVTNPFTNYGGGVRVKEIALENKLDGTLRKTSYDYSSENNESVISGVTSYEPVGINKYDNYGYSESDELIKLFRQELLRGFADVMLNAKEAPAPGVMYENVTVSESITDKNNVEREIPSRSTYFFEVFGEGMLGSKVNNSGSLGNLGQVVLETHEVGGNTVPLIEVDNNTIATTDVTIKDFTTQIGTLKRVVLRDDKDQKISETINHYLHDEVDMTGLFSGSQKFNALITSYEPLIENRFNSQGIIEETFINARFARDTRDAFQDRHQLIGVVTKRERFPAIQTGQTSVNYKTGITTTSRNLVFDFYSGVITKTVATDGYGNHYLTESVPAYRINEYEGGMGLAINGGKNMLTQNAATYVYKVDDPDLLNKEALMSAEIQTWQDKWRYREFDAGEFELSLAESDLNPVWRTHKSYFYKGDDQSLNDQGVYPYTDVNHPSFNSWLVEDPMENPQWQKSSEVTLYDRNSHALEAMDLNGHYAATKMGYSNTKIVSSASNSKYGEFAFSGAEGEPMLQTNGQSFFGGEVEHAGGVRSSQSGHGALTHTGEYSIKTVSAERAFQYTSDDLEPNRTYRLSVWMTDLAGDLKYSINEGNAVAVDETNARSSNGWYLVSSTVEMPSNVTNFEMWTQGSSGATVYFDDFRLQPIDGAMTAYVYDILTDELSYVLNNNNMYTKYNYDVIGRLASTHIETFEHDEVKTGEFEYTYSRNDTKFDITATALGGGTVTPSSVQLNTGGNTVIELTHDECLYHVVEIEVDGQVMTGSSERIGGTDFYHDSDELFLNNIRGDHQIQVSYLPTGYVAAGTKVYFSCEQDQFGCPTGQVEYKTSDGCGGYNEASGAFSYEESSSCCDNPPTGCSACTTGGGSN